MIHGVRFAAEKRKRHMDVSFQDKFSLLKQRQNQGKATA
jgi:hypothetical protein